MRRYADPGDQEIAGLVAASFAYGQVRVLCRAVERILEAMGPSPRQALLEDRHERPGFARGFRYRFQSRGDLIALLRGAAGLIRAEGSLGAALAERLPPRPLARSAGAGAVAGAGVGAGAGAVAGAGAGAVAGVGVGVGPDALDAALARWVADLRALAGVPLRPALCHLIADPASGGAGKRWRLYLRWMVRPDDGIDVGAWAHLFSPADLTLPLDTHWVRLGYRLGLTRRRTPDGKMAREITAALRALDPRDPLRYDLPICHLGIDGGCPRELRQEDCRSCPLRAGCACADLWSEGGRPPA